MSHLSSDKFNVAWFKLAEFVGRKEKERALGIYRLLIHSLPGEALRLQLEGDLLIAFNDLKALACYSKAADSYEKEGKLREAIGVYEHCLCMTTASLEYILPLIRLYSMLGHESKIIHYMKMAIRLFIAKHDFEAAYSFFEASPLSHSFRIVLLEFLISSALQSGICSSTALAKPLAELLNCYQDNTSKNITSFMESLQHANPEAYAFACNYLMQKGYKESFA